jgi:capsular exopolysaccharide synthesis family protein
MNETNNRVPIRRIPENLPSVLSTGDRLDGRGHHAEEGEIELREYWRILWKYKIIIAAVTVAATMLSLIYAFTVTPRYTAESTIRISTYEPVLSATRVEDVLQDKSRESNYLETQIQEIKSFSLADKVLSSPKVRDTLVSGRESPSIFSKFLSGSSPDEDSGKAEQAFDGVTEYKNPLRQIKSYLKSVEVKPVRRTSLVIISATAENAVNAALYANSHALSYIDWVREKRMEQQARGLQFLTAQAEELREKVGDLEREMADYAESNSIVALNKDENITVQKMSRLNQLLTEATAKRIFDEKAYQGAEASLTKNSAGFDDPSTQVTRSELAKLDAEYQQLASKFTDSYPKMQQLKAQIERLKESVGSQREQIVAGLKSKYLASVEEEKNLKEELEQQKSQTFELSKREVQYNVLSRELTTSRELLQSVLKQSKETSLAVESNSSNVSIVDYAAIPLRPSFPVKTQMLALGLIAGFLAGVGLAFLLSYIDNSIRTPEDVQRSLRLASLGVIPSFGSEYLTLDSAAGTEDGKGPISQARNLPMVRESQVPIMYLSSPRSLAAEAYRTIRTGILLSQAGSPPRVILVSSAQSSEGKTTTTINLAASLASTGGKVVLIDADLRRPSLIRHFKIDEERPGLTELLTGLSELEEVVIPDLMPGVSVIPSGRIPPNPAELLGSNEMVAVLDSLAETYDYVLIDSPPILPVTDSVVLARYVDGVVFVIKGGATPRKVARDAKNRLLDVGARLIGVILNDIDVNNGDYHYYNRYYYSYYHKDGTVKPSTRAAG